MRTLLAKIEEDEFGFVNAKINVDIGIEEVIAGLIGTLIELSEMGDLKLKKLVKEAIKEYKEDY